MRKIFSILLVAAMLLGVFVGCGDAGDDYTDAVATSAVTEEVNYVADDIAILYTNDVHTYIDGPLSYDVIAAIKEEFAERYAGVLLVDAGDHIQGTAYGSMNDGATIIEMMNAAGYDVATLGNHEFDYGMDGCMAAIEWAAYPYVSANFYHEKNGVKGECVLEPYVTFTVGNETIAFVGITTPETFTKSTPAYFQDENGNYIYGISSGEDGSELYADVQAAINGGRRYQSYSARTSRRRNRVKPLHLG